MAGVDPTTAAATGTAAVPCEEVLLPAAEKEAEILSCTAVAISAAAAATTDRELLLLLVPAARRHGRTAPAALLVGGGGSNFHSLGMCSAAERKSPIEARASAGSGSKCERLVCMNAFCGPLQLACIF